MPAFDTNSHASRLATAAGGAPFVRELAQVHCLMMLVAARANGFLDRAAPAPPGTPPARAVQEAVRLSGICARLMDSYRTGLVALHELRKDAREAGKTVDSVRAIDEPAHGPRRNPAAEGAARQTVASKGLGRLNNGNPAGDFRLAPRCGARTRSGGPCRQPAMANARCRFHGGKSTGPRTEAGRERCRRARYVHGAGARDLRALRSAACHAARRLAALTRAARLRPAGHEVLRTVSRSLGQGVAARYRSRAETSPTARSETPELYVSVPQWFASTDASPAGHEVLRTVSKPPTAACTSGPAAGVPPGRR